MLFLLSLHFKLNWDEPPSRILQNPLSWPFLRTSLTAVITSPAAAGWRTVKLYLHTTPLYVFAVARFVWRHFSCWVVCVRSGPVLLLGRGRRSGEVEVNLQTCEFSRISSLWGNLNMRTKCLDVACAVQRRVCLNVLILWTGASRPGGTRSDSLWNLQQRTDHLDFIPSAPS